MSGYSPEVTRRGNYRCPYCTHSSWKRRSYAVNHIHEHHKADAEISSLNQTIGNKNVELERLRKELAEAKKPKPAPYVPPAPVASKKPEREYYDAVVYCSNCLIVFKCGLPKGVLISNVSHSECGNCTLHKVINAPSWW